MKMNKLKIALFIILLIASALACEAVSGDQATPTSPPPPPTIPPLPSPTTAPPTPTTAPPTPTTAPPPTDTPSVEPPPSDGEILFQDDFSDSTSGWDTYSDEDGSTVYANGKYQISVFTTSFFYWANPYRNFTDVIVEVQVEKTTTNDDVQMGIVCRHQDVENWYVLVISGDGYAAIRKRYQGGELGYIAEWVNAPSVNQGTAINNLRAECVGNRLTLYANGVKVVETFDGDISTGDVGLLAGTFENADNLEVLFDNFVVKRP
jgi:hypothetical protein